MDDSSDTVDWIKTTVKIFAEKRSKSALLAIFKLGLHSIFNIYMDFYETDYVIEKNNWKLQS